MRAAFDLSERYHTPVIVRPTTRINHASTFFDVAEADRWPSAARRGLPEGSQVGHFPKRAYEGHGEINRRLAQIAWDYAHDPAFAQFNEVFEGGGEGETIGVVRRMASKVLERPRSCGGHRGWRRVGSLRPRGVIAY